MADTTHVPFLTPVTVDGPNIQRIIFDRLSPAVEDEDLEQSIVALLVFAILLMKPDIEQETLQDLLLNVSQQIILATTVPTGPAN